MLLRRFGSLVILVFHEGVMAGTQVVILDHEIETMCHVLTMEDNESESLMNS